MIGYQWHDLVGNVGVVLILLMYLAVQLDRIDVRGLTYTLVNGAGAALILVSLINEFNLSAFLIELAWFGISVFGLIRRYAIGSRKLS